MMRAAARALAAAYPLLMAATPVVYLAVRNVAQVTPDQVVLPLLVLLAATGAALAVLGRGLRDRARAAALVTVALVVLFTGGSLYGALAGALGPRLSGVAAGAALALAAAVLWGAWRFTGGGAARLQATTTTLGVMALVLFANMAGPLLLTAKGRAFFAPDRIGAGTAPQPHPVRDGDSPEFPDIYYIVADGYAREDVLQREYGYDNAAFTGWLETRGFHVARDSWSNYGTTYLSLASSLNMRLVGDDAAAIVARSPGADDPDRTPFYRMIQQPEVARRLQLKGYRYAQTLTHWAGTDRSALADIRYRFAPFLGGEFGSALAGMTLLGALGPTLDELHHFVAGAVPRIAEIEGPTFAFVHLLLPHNPYVFDHAGRVVATYPLTISLDLQDRAWRLREPYVEQLRYTNTLLQGMIDAILERSRTPPIIIVQGDHGSALSGATRGVLDPRERLAILNAYRVPEAVRAKLYPGITPVNTFRLLLSTQFGDELPLLPDTSWLASKGGPYDLRDVTAELRGGVPAPTPEASRSSR